MSVLSRSVLTYFAAVVSLSFFLFFSFSFAATDRFEVTLSPDTITAWDFTDLTIKALDETGNVDPSYGDDIFIEIEGLDFNDPDVVLPWWGFYFFESSDQWVKIFSKWLTIKKWWTYTVNVVDALVDVTGIQWSATLTVNEEWSLPEMWTLDVSAPLSWSVVTEDRIAVVATTSLPNSPIVLFVDDKKVQEWLSDQNWWITMYVSGITKWDHTLKMNAVDLWWTIVATSDDIPFTYDPIDHGALFVGLEILPSNNVLEWDQVTMRVTTAELVDSVTVKVWEGDFLPMSKVSEGVFEKKLLMEAEWVYDVDLGIMVDGTNTAQDNVDTITVRKDIKEILTLTYDPDVWDDKVDLVWTYTWAIDYFRLEYGMSRSELDLSLSSTNPNAIILLTDPTKTRYAKVSPVNETGEIVGTASQIIEINPLRDPDPVCGNGLVEQGEECDDENTLDADGCSALCRIELATCGNRKIELWEECDDGNLINNDGCSTICKIEIAICGNGTIELWEECDDGNILAWDTCSPECTIHSAPPVAPPASWSECVTSGIEIATKQIGGSYYLYWAAVPDASKYYVYRRESRPWSVSQMSLVWETVDPLFEYPFDPNSTVDQYARYAVEAECNGQKQQLWDFTKVQVWPEQTVLLVLLMTFLLWGMWKMKGQQKIER